MNIADKLQTIAENEQKVYDAGKKAEYDKFWDIVLRGNISKYHFAGKAWTSTTFNPPSGEYYVENAQGLFCECAITDLAEIFEKNEFSLDFSNCSIFGTCFYFCRSLTHLPVLDLRKIEEATNMFAYSSKLHTIDGLIFSEDGLKGGTNQMFYNCTALENITISGKIKANISFSSCTKLTHASLMSIINALFDLTSDGTATKTLTLGTANQQKLTEEEQAIAIQKGWTIA